MVHILLTTTIFLHSAASVHVFFFSLSVELLYNLFTSPQAAAEQSTPWATSSLGRELLIQVFIFLLVTFLCAF